MTRCKIKSCKKKLDRDNTVQIDGYIDTEVEKGIPITPKTKIKICSDCGKLYFGIYWDNDKNQPKKVYNDNFIHRMEFHKEFIAEVLGE